MKVLIVWTSDSPCEKTKVRTGFWIEEFATPYYALSDGGVDVTIASPKGGQPLVDHRSDLLHAPRPATERFYKDNILIDKVANSLKFSDVNEEDYEAIFYW